MTESERMDKELADYLIANAMGHAAAKTKQQVVEAMHDRGVLGLGMAYQHAARALCDARVRLVAADIPVGTCNEGWYICQNQGELNAVKAREAARAQAIFRGNADLERAFYTFTARRLGTGLAGQQHQLPSSVPGS